MNIAQLLKKRRQELGVTQTQLTIACGWTSKSNVCKLENGDLPWRFENVQKACEFLGLELVVREKAE